jgi:outer membrane protein W
MFSDSEPTGNKSLLVFLLSVLFLNVSANAQQLLGLSYDISQPVLNTSELVSATSLIGFGLDARQMYSPKVSYGVTFHWNSFKDDHVEKVEAGEEQFISIDERSMESFPIMFSTHFYFFNREDDFRPFLGTNVGTYFIITRRTVNGVRVSDNNWHLGVAPDIGFMLHFRHEMHVMLTIRFNLAAKTSRTPEYTYWSVIFELASVRFF